MKYQSGTRWESEYAYSRAVRVGERVFVAGTTAMKDGQLVGIGDPVAQAHQVFANIKTALENVGASLSDVVRTRMYIIRREDATAIAEVHGSYFAGIDPASTLVIVAGLLEAEMLVEIEAEAIVNHA